MRLEPYCIRHVALLVCLLQCLGGRAHAAPPPPLQLIRDVVERHQISAAEGLSVRVKGTVTAFEPQKGRMVIQDGSGALAVSFRPAEFSLQAGQEAELVLDGIASVFSELPDYPHRPHATSHVSSSDFGSLKRENFIQRITGVVQPPVSGDYTFYLSGDDQAELWITDLDPAGPGERLAWIYQYTLPDQWSRYPEQKSRPLSLHAGRRYLVEILHQQMGGADHVTVEWAFAGSPQGNISGEHLYEKRWVREVWFNAQVTYLLPLHGASAYQHAISARKVTVVSRSPGSFPTPKELRLHEALSPADAYVWSRVHGVVRSVTQRDSTVFLELKGEARRVVVEVLNGTRSPLPPLHETTVDVLGVAEPGLNEEGLTVVHRFVVPGFEHVKWSSRPFVRERLPFTPLNRLAATVAEPTNVRFAGRLIRNEAGEFALADDGVFSAYASRDGHRWAQLGKLEDVAFDDEAWVGLVVTSRSNEKQVRTVFSEIKGLSQDSIDVQVGGRFQPGTVRRTGDSVVMTGSGGDIWDWRDDFYFYGQKKSGTWEVSARIDSIDGSGTLGKVGIMMRSSLDSTASFVDVVMQTLTRDGPAYGPMLQSRSGNWGAVAINEASLDYPLPVWLNLRRDVTVVQLDDQQIGDFHIGDRLEASGVMRREGTSLFLAEADLRPFALSSLTTGTAKVGRPIVPIGEIVEPSHRERLEELGIRGIVTFTGDVAGEEVFAIQDSTGAAFVVPPPGPDRVPIAPGDYIQVDCRFPSSPVDTRLVAQRVIKLGSGVLPRAVMHPAEFSMPNRGEAWRVQAEGILYAVLDGGVAVLRCGENIVSLHVENMDATRWTALIDARVQVEGVALRTAGGESALLADSVSAVQIVTPAPAVSTLPLQSIRELITPKAQDQPAHRVRTAGVVTLSDRGFLFVQEGEHALRVEMEGDFKTAVGEHVELLGFPQAAGRHSASLIQARVLNRRDATAVQPISISDEAFLDAAGRSVLVRVQGVLAKRQTSLHGEELTVQLGPQTIVTAVIPSGVPTEHLPIGSVIEVIGVSSFEGEMQKWIRHRAGLQVRTPAVLVRNAGDLRAIERPGWWRLRQALLVIGGLAAALIAGAFWVYVLRRRIHERTLQLQRAMDRLKRETELSATLTERNRLAGEIHDSLQQSFSGLMLQLDGATRLPTCSPEIQQNLRRAKGMINFSMSEMRHLVWDLHSPTLEKMELPAALERIVSFMHSGSAHLSITTQGVVRRLTPALESHLLRIAQEGIANAVKHAGASKIEVRLEYDAESVTLRVSDNGIGFDPNNVLTEQQGHFGLRGLRSRAKKIGGTLTLHSRQGEGTVVSVRIPTPSSKETSPDHA